MGIFIIPGDNIQYNILPRTHKFIIIKIIKAINTPLLLYIIFCEFLKRLYAVNPIRTNVRTDVAKLGEIIGSGTSDIGKITTVEKRLILNCKKIKRVNKIIK